MKNICNLTSNYNVVVLYEPASVKVNTIEEHLKSFVKYSVNNISYLPATQSLPCVIDLNVFDVLIIHYSVRLSIPSGNLILSESFQDAVKSFGGFKILFIQDEYEGTEIARRHISQLGIHAVYTCVPQTYINIIYPKSRFPKVEFLPTLTGYVPSSLTNIPQPSPVQNREFVIGYRGRELPFWYGALGQEKLNIGLKVKEYCQSNKIPVDIEWEESKRIYNGWYDFLASCKSTLGTESGSNIFDFDGSVRRNIEEKLLYNPSLKFDEIYEEYLKPLETVKMNQISPKIFEAAAMRTALILFEGEYSGILTPELHYIPLKKDFSNLDEVIAKVQNDNYIDGLTKQTFSDLIKSNKYSYERFVHEVDQYIASKVRKTENNKELLYSYKGYYFRDNYVPDVNQFDAVGLPFKTVLNFEQIKFLKTHTNLHNYVVKKMKKKFEFYIRVFIMYNKFLLLFKRFICLFIPSSIRDVLKSYFKRLRKI